MAWAGGGGRGGGHNRWGRIGGMGGAHMDVDMGMHTSERHARDGG